MYNKIKKLFIDVDGTLSDGMYSISSSGELSKSFYTRDFYAIEQVIKTGIQVVIMSQAQDNIINKQIERLKNGSLFWYDAVNITGSLLLYTAVGNKFSKISNDLLGNKTIGWGDITWEHIAYIGDAENDEDCVRAAALSACPSDAVSSIIHNAIWVSKHKGGKGAVHDFCMFLLECL